MHNNKITKAFLEEQFRLVITHIFIEQQIRANEAMAEFYFSAMDAAKSVSDITDEQFELDREKWERTYQRIFQVIGDIANGSSLIWSSVIYSNLMGNKWSNEFYDADLDKQLQEILAQRKKSLQLDSAKKPE